MSTIPLSDEPNNVAYDIQLSEMHGRLHASRPAALKPEYFNARSLARVAQCMAAGVKFDNAMHVVLGSADWQGPDAPDLSGCPAELPDRIKLHEDGQGHTEVHRGRKLGFRICAVPTCGADFIVKRGAKKNAAWPKTCSDECRKEWRRMRDRANYAAA